MTWIIAIALAAICFAVCAFVFRLPKASWTVLLAALALGLAGYSMQASPGLPGAPKAAREKPSPESGWALVELRKNLIGKDNLSRDPKMVTADALIRQGQFENAIAVLSRVTLNNPNDAEAWLAMANALTFHADGVMTPAALMAYRKAGDAQPDGAGAAFFLGLSLISSGEIIQGHQLWSGRLQSMPEDGPGRAILAERLGQLDEMLRRAVAESENTPR